MTKTVYTIHQAINRPVTFRGLKGQYIIFAAVGLIGDLFLFILLYCCRIPALICVGTAVMAGAITLYSCTQLSARYGQHGLLKKRASRRIPPYLRCHSRKIFTNLNKKICTNQPN
jgi:hypothetical protein